MHLISKTRLRIITFFLGIMAIIFMISIMSAAMYVSIIIYNMAESWYVKLPLAIIIVVIGMFILAALDSILVVIGRMSYH